MAKTKVSEFDAVASNNTDINSVNVAEGCPPSGINNAIREMASLLKKQEVGTDAMTSPDIDGGTIDGATIGASSPSTGAFTTLTASGNLSVDGGTIKLDGNYPVGSNNVALGNTALDSVASGGNHNVAIGNTAGTALTTGSDSVAVGSGALATASTAVYNVAIGMNSLGSATGSNNTAVGRRSLRNTASGEYNVGIGADSLFSNTTADNNTAVGYQAGYSNTTGSTLDAFGKEAGYSNTTGYSNSMFGSLAGYSNTTGVQNVAIGNNSFYSNTTGGENVSVGVLALYNNTTGSYNTAIGKQALTSNTTASNNTAVGYQAGFSTTTEGKNTYIGYQAGYNNLGDQNVFVGRYAGGAITNGDKNTIIGKFNGNENGLDIRTADNYIVLSDGDGNPRMTFVSNGRAILGTTGVIASSNAVLHINADGVASGAGSLISQTTLTSEVYHVHFRNGNGATGGINTNGTSTAYVTSSDHRLKENVVDMTGAIDRVKLLSPKRFNFIADADTTVDGFLAHEAQTVVAEAVTGTHNEVDDDGNPVMQGIDQAKIVPLLTGALKEAIAKIEDLEARIATLEGA